eukprot:m.79666 g.79666  ORF g.79666 m.79666 type:complete len:309 (-) comp19312_c0_seq1:287-1213(-)
MRTMGQKGETRLARGLECLRTVVLAIPPGIVWVLLIWSYYVFNYLYVLNYVVSPFSQGLYISVYHAVLIVFATTFYRACTSIPARPPSQFDLNEDEMSDLEDGTSPGDIVQERRLPIKTLAHNDCVRYCGACRALKPDRTHHCSICRRCVLKMDHHCPWVGNCVGWHNYKFFVLFLFWGVIYLGTFMVGVFPVVEGFISAAKPKSTRYRPGQGPILVSFLLSMSFSFSMLILLCFHLFLIAANRTTLEGFRSLNFIRRNTQGWRHPTILANFEEVFGPLSYRWLLPVGKGSQGNGWNFHVFSSDINHV